MNKFNGWLKIIVTGLITIALSIGTTLFTSGKQYGAYEEKVNQLECKVEKAERNYSLDHDILIRIAEKVDNIEKMIKKMEEVKSNHR